MGERNSAPVQIGLLCSGYRVFSGVKRPGRGVDHPPHLVPRLMKKYSYISISALGLRSLFLLERYCTINLCVLNVENAVFIDREIISFTRWAPSYGVRSLK